MPLFQAVTRHNVCPQTANSGLHDRYRAWKGFDWGAMDRLHEKGFISNPAGKAKSVVFTEEGLREAERLFRELFAARR